ncbi:hypothetical protein SLS53_005009 [Cytospora paraplurivora]|uniref:Uncharacterized protein n=1 Tax=Cytospora paraplurivora TaxID=2898453 RepID=A0AAN9U8H8_9PEZI
MARYHEEDGAEANERTKTNRTLSREHWEGQVHRGGLGKSAIHARHMRSRFALIPRANKKQKPSWKLCSTAECFNDRPVRGKESDFAVFAYFLNSKDTTERDKDQVVYRATRRPFKDPGHGDVTRIMMVDQLWLWILDDYTIITCFPKRWGRNKPDSSGIHKSFRERLIHLDKEVMSVWHLAFLIIDQCSRVFFDRTKPLDMRPEVMDIFAETLGVVNDYKTVAYEAFWRNVEVAATSQKYGRFKVPNPKYLHINPEGRLLREAQDIAEELRIMIGIYAQQLSVVKDFHKCLEQLNGGPIGARDRDLKRLVRHLSVMWEHQTNAAIKTFQSLGELESLDDMIEEIESRKIEIEDLESVALRTCQQLQELLSLKQQQAGIVEAKAALERAVCISLMIIIFVLVLAFNKILRRPFEPLEKLWKDRDSPWKESRNARQEMGKSVEFGIWPSPALGDAMGRYHLGVPQQQRRDGRVLRTRSIGSRSTQVPDDFYSTLTFLPQPSVSIPQPSYMPDYK